MKSRYACAVIFPMLVVATSFSQKPQQPASATTSVSIHDEAAVSGVWRGQFEGLPWATVTLTDEGGGVSGAIVFYLHRRDPGGQLSSTPSVPEPLLNPHFVGRVLSFAVSHRHAHPPGSLTDAPIHLRIDFTNKDHATLLNQDESDPSAALERSDY
jgi:hypothetical protein